MNPVYAVSGMLNFILDGSLYSSPCYRSNACSRRPYYSYILRSLQCDVCLSSSVPRRDGKVVVLGHLWCIVDQRQGIVEQIVHGDGLDYHSSLELVGCVERISRRLGIDAVPQPRERCFSALQEICGVVRGIQGANAVCYARNFDWPPCRAIRPR